jgi:hypothetical protein
LDDSLGFAKLLILIYKEGKATFGKFNFNPSLAIKNQQVYLDTKAS